MRDLSSLKLEDFQTCLDQTFTVNPEDTESLELELTQVKPIGTLGTEAETRQSFSLLFYLSYYLSVSNNSLCF